MFGSIWPKTRELDMCVPGPDILWQARADSEMQRNSNLLSEKIDDDDPKKATSASIALKDLKFAVNFFKDWINNKMMTTLPKSVIYMDAVDEIETLYQESDELIDARRLKTQAVSRLEAIKSGLDSIAEQPEPGSGEEKVLIKLKQQYDATRDTISNTATINNRKNQLNIAIDKYKKLNELIPECQQQRTEKGWTNPGGRKSTYLDKGTEQNLFCDFPIKGGYSHNSFIGPDTIVPKVPMVNGKDVMNWPRFFGLFGTKRVNIEMNCDLIYKANVLDYKGSLPGLTPITEDFEDLSGIWGGGGEQCDDLGEQYAGALRDAMDAVLAENPSVGDLPNIESGGRQNARTFLALVETELISRGFNATDEVLNGNNNPSTGDIIAVWMDGDTMMERYDAIIGSASTIGAAATTDFTGFIPLNCTASGGGTNCGCSSGGTEPPTPGPNSNPTPGSNTVITSINPVTAQAGVTTLTINGSNLTNQVSFYDNAGARNTVVGTVNSAKTQTTVLVPADLPQGNATVKIYQGNQIWSNGILILVNSSGCVGSITTANPISTWSPQTNNGWWGKLSPDGRYVTYGNFGGNWGTDLQANQTWDLSNPAGSGITTGAGCRAGEWITATTLTFVCELVDNGIMARYEVKVGEWVPRITNDDKSLVRATIFAAKDGHWASYLASNPGRITKDNVVLAANSPGGALSIGGNTLVHACDGSNNPDLCVWDGSTLSKVIDAQIAFNETYINGGYILYAGGSSVRGVDPYGNDTNKKIGTFSFEGKPDIFMVRGAPWIATSVESNSTNKSYVILRPWNSRSAIVLDTGNPDSGSVTVDVVFDGTNFVIAHHTNKGLLKVEKVPENAARNQF